MKFTESFTLTYDVSNVHHDCLSQEALCKIHKDGRIAGIVVEHLYSHLFDNVRRADSERAPYDLEITSGDGTLLYQSKVGHWRTPASSVDLSRSNQKGTGRRYDYESAIKNQEGLDGYVVTDLEQFPRLKVWAIPIDRLIPLIGEKSFKVKFAALDELATRSTQPYY